MLVVEPGFGVPLFVSLLRAGTDESNYKSWVQVAMRGTTSGKWKGVHTKQQYNGAQAVYNLDAYANGEIFCVCETVCALFVDFGMLPKTVYCCNLSNPA